MRPLHEDPQNVHRKELIGVHQPILEWLLQTSTNLLTLEETLSRIHNGLLKALKNTRRDTSRGWRGWFEAFFGLPDRRVVALMENLKKCTACPEALYTTKQGLKYSFADILRLVVSKVYEINNPDLAKRLLLELCDGMGYCVGGQAARLLNTFCGFDFAPQVDPRSSLERVGDEMSVLAKAIDLSTEERIKRGLQILYEAGIEEGHRAVWLEALHA